MSTTTCIIMMAVCLLLSAYFSATETAFSSANTTRLRTLAEKGSGGAALALTAGSTALCLRTGSAPFLMIGALGTLFAALGGKKGLSNLRKACKI